MDRYPWLQIRAGGFEKMREILRGFRRQVVVVETGCYRGHEEGDGASTKVLRDIVGEIGGRMISIDIEEKHCAIARVACPEVRVICGDSIKVLWELGGMGVKVDLLYLDSMDGDWANMIPSAVHHLGELCAASRMLWEGSAVFVDDNREDGVGKGMFVKSFLKDIGAEQVWDGYNIGFVLPRPVFVEV